MGEAPDSLLLAFTPWKIHTLLMVQKSGDHHLGCIKEHGKSWDKLPNLNWLVRFLNHQHISHENRSHLKICRALGEYVHLPTPSIFRSYNFALEAPSSSNGMAKNKRHKKEETTISKKRTKNSPTFHDLFSRHLFSTHLFSKHLFSTHLFSKHLFSLHLFSTHLFSLIFKTS